MLTTTKIIKSKENGTHKQQREESRKSLSNHHHHHKPLVPITKAKAKRIKRNENIRMKKKEE
jgi:hypothetical protein